MEPGYCIMCCHLRNLGPSVGPSRLTKLCPLCGFPDADRSLLVNGQLGLFFEKSCFVDWAGCALRHVQHGPSPLQRTVCVCACECMHMRIYTYLLHEPTHLLLLLKMQEIIIF